MKYNKQNNATQALIGFQSFSGNGLMTTHGELVFYLISPTNISVLSASSIHMKIRNLMQLLIAQPDIEIVCMDDCECFDGNKEYLKSRLDQEKNRYVRDILDKDLKFLDEIQLSMSTARKFMFIYRIRKESQEQSFATLNRIEKAISEQGFEVKRAGKADIKRLLAIYFGYMNVDEELPDNDGERAVKTWLVESGSI